MVSFYPYTCLWLALLSPSLPPSHSPFFLLPFPFPSFFSSFFLPPLFYFLPSLLPPSFFLYSSGVIYSSVLPQLISNSVKNPKSVSVLGYSELLMRFAARNPDSVSQLHVRAWRGASGDLGSDLCLTSQTHFTLLICKMGRQSHLLPHQGLLCGLQETLGRRGFCTRQRAV